MLRFIIFILLFFSISSEIAAETPPLTPRQLFMKYTKELNNTIIRQTQNNDKSDQHQTDSKTTTDNDQKSDNTQENFDQDQCQCPTIDTDELNQEQFLKKNNLQISDNGEIKWSYFGKNGPKYWGDLDPKFNLCKTGSNQSPIDIKTKYLDHKNDIVFNYYPITAINDGKTVNFNIDHNVDMTVNSKNYRLIGIKIRTPSEHSFDGKKRDMELQFFHYNDNGEIAIVSSFFKTSNKITNPAIDAMIAKIPKIVGKTYILDQEKIYLYDLLPEDRSYYYYQGSLTFPPCSENIHWYIMHNTVPISKKQMEKLSWYLGKSNIRPIQNLNNRKIY